MPSPILTFAFILATLFGATFHLIFGGNARRLAVFLLFGWMGFALGHLAGVMFQFNLFNIGTLRVVSASIGALILLTFALFLTSQRTRQRSAR